VIPKQIISGKVFVLFLGLLKKNGIGIKAKINVAIAEFGDPACFLDF
jgi:hypothetical protein